MKYLDGGANKNVIIHIKLICEHCRQKKKIKLRLSQKLIQHENKYF